MHPSTEIRGLLVDFCAFLGVDNSWEDASSEFLIEYFEKSEAGHYIYFTDEEIAALQVWFPRVAVSNTIQEDTPEFTVIEKLVPSAIPTSMHHPRAPEGCIGDPGAGRCPHGCFYRCDG